MVGLDQPGAEPEAADMAEAMDQVLTPAEKEAFIAHVRPQVEQRQAIEKLASRISRGETKTRRPWRRNVIRKLQDPAHPAFSFTMTSMAFRFSSFNIS